METKKLIVERIPASIKKIEERQVLMVRSKVRVAAYCRVSTADESQKGSFLQQKQSYTEMIESNPSWELFEIYADEAKSGMSRKNRVQFNKMMDDAEAGCFEYIITKSISRFARCTRDTLECVEKLKHLNPPVGVYFEKEQLDTLDSGNEFILTILAAIAQDESQTISENIRWGIRERFAQGKTVLHPKRVIGFCEGEDGEWAIDEEQAEIVRLIFERYGCGDSLGKIARLLNQMGYKTGRGNRWCSNSIGDILRNELFVGDCMMQKTITIDISKHKSIRNDGYADRYYVRDHHPAIISRAMWERTKLLLFLKSPTIQRIREGRIVRPQNVLNRLSCGNCGHNMIKRAYSARAHEYQAEGKEGEKGFYAFNYAVLRCYHRFEDGIKSKNGRLSAEERAIADARCNSLTYLELAVQQSFMECLCRMKAEYQEKGDKTWFVLAYRRYYQKTEVPKLEEHRKNREQIMEEMEQLRMDSNDLRKKLQTTMLRASKIPIDGISLFRKGEANLKKLVDILKDVKDDVDVLEQTQQYIEALKRLEALYEKLDLIDEAEKNEFSSTEQFDYFLKALSYLPDISEPEMLPFSESIFNTFIASGECHGDEIIYHTYFGVDLKTTGNSRTLEDFIGYRKEGGQEKICYGWEAINNKIGWRSTGKCQK